MDIQKIHSNWNELGTDDPLWVVLTDPSKRGNRWNEEEFLETGRQDVASSISQLERCGITVGKERALDFGCGVGRLSQALAAHWKSVDGVDVSASMIAKANELNRAPESVHFHVNVRADLSAFARGSYDFVFSKIALQHIPPAFQLQYIADFMRLLKPGGVAFFQTIHALGWRRFVPHLVADFYRRLREGGGAFISLYGVPVETVRAAIVNGGGKVSHHESVPYADCEARYRSDLYIATVD